jgi:calcineurin-like phosphoesterase family protein
MQVFYNNEELDNNRNTIFLAGPTSRTDTTNSWRKDAIRLLEENGFTGNIVAPETRDSKVTDYDATNQITWERKCLTRANIILFWIPRSESLPAFTTNIEFGEWYNSGKVFLGFPDDAIKMNYIKFLSDNYSLSFHNTLESLVQDCIRTLNRDSKEWFSSDTHFNQERTRVFSKRPFKTVDEMNVKFISNWNSLVYEQDHIFHLGDFGDYNYISTLCFDKMYFLCGNYDNDEFKIKLLANDERIEFIEPNTVIERDGEKYQLIHEPEESNNPDAFYLYGHVHRLSIVKRNGLNVGIDCHFFKPIDIETIKFQRNGILNHYDENVFQSQMN